MKRGTNIVAWVLIAGLPPTLLSLGLLADSDLMTPLRWTLAVGAVAWWSIAAVSLSAGIQRPLRTLASVVRALREGEYVTRARVSDRHPRPVAEALTATNELAEMLDQHRLEVVDATTLLQRIMDEVDVALVGFDEQGKVQLCNRVAEGLFPGQRLQGRTAGALGIEDWLDGASPRIVEPPGVVGRRWQLRRAALRQGGRPFRLVTLSDLGKVLDDEARRSAYRVVRVLSHEVNNSLAPIGSVAEALASRIPADAGGDQERLKKNLTMIADRTEGLGRFLSKFTELAKLPPPAPGPVDVAAWIHRVAALETRHPVEVIDGPPLTIDADASQLDRALINLVKNAVDAGGPVTLGWTVAQDRRVLLVHVRDEGPGLLDTSNLFVPFYTTKPEGAGIGLSLSREIARNHGGDLTLQNRPDHTGCEATLTLPLR